MDALFSLVLVGAMGCPTHPLYWSKTVTEVNQELNKITPAMIEGQIVAEYYFSGLDGLQGADQGDKLAFKIAPGYTEAREDMRLVTFCILVLKNKFMSVGKSAVADPANYDQEIGRKVAREDALRQLWAPMGYQLRSRLVGVNGLT